MLKIVSGAVGVFLLTMFSMANAALPAGVTTAITDATADGTDLAYALLGMAVAVGILFWLKRKA